VNKDDMDEFMGFLLLVALAMLAILPWIHIR